MRPQSKQELLPGKSHYFAWAEFIELAGIHPSRVDELIEIGWIETRSAGSGGAPRHLFREVDIYRVRKLERICTDFELPVHGGVIIVDLLDRIDDLENKVRELNALLGR